MSKKEGNEYFVVDFFLKREMFRGSGKDIIWKIFQGHTLNGPVVTYYDNGILKSKASYKNKKLDGESTHMIIFGNIVEQTYIKTELFKVPVSLKQINHFNNVNFNYPKPEKA